jgi:hypothetical protein
LFQVLFRKKHNYDFNEAKHDDTNDRLQSWDRSENPVPLRPDRTGRKVKSGQSGPGFCQFIITKLLLAFDNFLSKPGSICIFESKRMCQMKFEI